MNIRLRGALWFTVLWTAYIALQIASGCLKSIFQLAELFVVWLFLLAAGAVLVFFCKTAQAGPAFCAAGFAVLAALDQAVKLLVSSKPARWSVSLMGGLLKIRPVRNIYNASALDYFGVRIPTAAVVAGKAAVFGILIVVIVYIRKKYRRDGADLNLCAMFLFSGIFCSILDSCVWGYSLDYLNIPNFCVADLKDLYLELGIGLLLLYAWRNGWFGRRNKEGKRPAEFSARAGKD